MSTKKEPNHRGTLVCVVLKAKNLPNKRSIGKQDPYCVLQMGTEQQKTKPDKRGGQHPTWDEQLHFEIFEDMEDQLRRKSADENGSISQATTLSSATKRKDKSGKTLRVSCYADDNKEPEFIGEGFVDLTDTLRSGEFDEWVTIKAKDRYAGEVYLELTFYSSAAPPKPKKTPKPYVGANTTYGGAGTFSEDFDESEFAPRPPEKQSSGHAPIPSGFMHGAGSASSSQLTAKPPQHARRGQNTSGMTSSHSHAQFGSIAGSESVPSALRPSASLAQIDSYTPPYAPSHIQRERSPAPSSTPSGFQDGHQRSESAATITPSPSAQFYGHRLPDAAPSTIVAQRMQENLRRQSQQMPSSSTYSQLPHSTSVSTIRPGHGGGSMSEIGGGVDELVGSMSSISMNHIPQGPNTNEATQQHPGMIATAPSSQNLTQYPPYHPQNGSYSQSIVTSPVGGIPPSMSIDQFGRQVLTQAPPTVPGQSGAQHYAYGAPPQQQPHQEVYQQPFQPPTSPAPPSNAIYATSSPYPVPPTAAYNSTPVQQQQSASHLVPSQSTNFRPASPGIPGAQQAPQPPPPRTHTPGGYHALPTPPTNQSSQQNLNEARAPSPLPYQTNNAQYPPAPASYIGQPHAMSNPSSSTSPPKPSGRPLPSTTPTPGPGISSTPSPSPYNQAGQPVSGSGYYGVPPSQINPNYQQPSQQQQYAQMPGQPIPSPSPQAGLPTQQQEGHPQVYGSQVSYPPQQPLQEVQYNGYAPQQGYAPQPGGMVPSMSSTHMVHYPPPPPGPKPSEYAGHSPVNHYGHPPPVQQQQMGQYAYQHPGVHPEAGAQQQGQPYNMPSAPSQHFTPPNQPQQYYHPTHSPAPTPY
ncbi:hypothetical protein L7F22_038976 [Adiantum nelumboides]|nr:hypothetical protein [Adiantum nelumboides]